MRTNAWCRRGNRNSMRSKRCALFASVFGGKRCALFASVFVLASWSDARANLVVTEVYYDSALADSTEPDEWIEVANAGTADLDLASYFIGDANDANLTEGALFGFPSVYLGPGEVALVAKSGTSFAATWTPPPGVKVFAMRDAAGDQYPMTHLTGWAGGPSAMALANGGDEVLVVTQSANAWSVVDAVSWGTGKTTVQFPTTGEAAFIDAPFAGGAGFGGQSIARRSARIDDDLASDWQRLATPTPGVAPLNVCGDGAVQPGETCDDGGTQPGDGCDASCAVACGYTCAGAPSACAVDCGDGLIADDETCDDANVIPGDGCDGACHVELGFACTAPACVEGASLPSSCILDPCLMPLHVSEVMADGIAEHASEWVELVNAGILPIPLGSWSFGDQALIAGSGEGSVRFPDGTTLAPGAVLVLAKDPVRFNQDTGRVADFSYGVNAPPIPFLSRASDWASGTQIELANDQDEVVLTCGGAVRDRLAWGSASGRVPAPSEYDAAHPQNGPHAFMRLDLASDPSAVASWAVTRCPSPGEAPAPNTPPDVGPAMVTVPAGGPTNLYLPGDDAGADALVFALQTAGLAGTAVLIDAARGVVRYTPPVGVNAVDTGFTFTVADGCVTSPAQSVTVHVAAPDCDPAQSQLRITEVHADARVDNQGEWIELANPTAAPIDLGFLRLGDEESLGGREGMFVFPAGAIVAPGGAVLVAFSAAEFEAGWGFAPDFEWNRDSNGNAADDLARDATWSSGTIRLDNDGDEVLVVGCDGDVIDALYWGAAAAGQTPVQTPWSVRAAATPDYPSQGGAGGSDGTPASLGRRAPTQDTDTAADWVIERCPTPGRAASGNAAPIAVKLARALEVGGSATGTVTATDADVDPLTWTFGPTTSGTLTSDPATGDFEYVAAAGATGVVVIEVAVSDGCAETQTTLQFCIGTVETADNNEDEDCDGQALCHVDGDGDGVGGASLELHPGSCDGAGVAALGGDCDDDLASVRPGAPEICDGHDNDCLSASPDGIADPQAGAPCDAAADADLCLDDGWGCTGGVAGCVDNPSGDATRVEVCDLANTDEDCDGGADDADPNGAPSVGAGTFYRDDDRDGFGRDGAGTSRCDATSGLAPVAGDCDDEPASCGAACSPGLGEATTFGNCQDGYDNDCDHEPPDQDDGCFAPLLCFRDKDRDGVGLATSYVVLAGAAVVQGCAAYADGTNPAGYWVVLAGDCDDEPTQCGAACRPGFQDICDGRDNDCVPQTVDGSGDPAVGVACDSSGDPNLCRDELSSCRNAAIVCDNVMAGDEARVERCDPLNADEDCDGLADDQDAEGTAGRAKYYPDADGDGRGVGTPFVMACDAPPGYVAVSGDCDDDPALCGAACRSGLVESRGAGNCQDAFDNDCDGSADLDPECFGIILCYHDADGDGYGVFATEHEFSGGGAEAGCAAFSDPAFPTGGWVANGLDCDDSPTGCGAACHPNASELCDGKDNDCSLATADGSGDGRVGVACDSVVDGDVCLDDRSACQSGGIVCVNVSSSDPNQVEVCDTGGVDEDCDGGANDADPQGAPSNASLWFVDADADGFGSSGGTVRACLRPSGYAPNASDCDDDPAGCGPLCRPGLLESCDGRDNDCRAETVDGADEAGVGVPCDAATDADRCLDDATACAGGTVACIDNTHGDAGRVEVCDDERKDEDCDGLADDDDPDGPPANATAWYQDRDRDAHGSQASQIKRCRAPAGFVVLGDDCDDDPTRCGASCAPDLVESLAGGNCTDGIDNDCDSQTDIAASCLPPITCQLDADEDGYGDPKQSTQRASTAGPCASWPDGSWVGNDDDCDDDAKDAHPGGTEVAGNAIDEDCNGRVSCWQDLDSDGFASDAAQTVEAPESGGCGLSPGLTATLGACDDDRTACGPACHPGATEVCDGFDNDCDEATDENVCETTVGAGYVDGGSGCTSGGADAWVGVVLGALAVGWRRRRARGA